MCRMSFDPVAFLLFYMFRSVGCPHLKELSWNAQACGFDKIRYMLLNVRGDEPLQMVSGAPSWAPTTDPKKVM